MVYKILHEIIIEKEGVSDDSYNILDVAEKSGSYVKKGSALFTYETSKSTVDVIAEFNGYFYHILDNSLQFNPGKIVGVLVDQPGFDTKNLLSSQEEKKIDGSTTVFNDNNALSGSVSFTRKAQELKNRVKAALEEPYHQDGLVTFRSLFDTLAQSVLYLSTEEDYLSNRIVLVGAGGMLSNVISIARYSGYSIVGVLDDNLPKGSLIDDIPVIGSLTDSPQLVYESGVRKAFVSFASPNNRARRLEVFKFLKKTGFQLPNLLHPNAFIDDAVVMGEGNLVLEGVTIGPNVKIGDLNYINSKSTLTHHISVGDNCHIAPGAIIAGNIEIGCSSLIGMGVTTVSGIEIGNNVTINNGSSVLKTVPDNAIIKKN